MKRKYLFYILLCLILIIFVLAACDVSEKNLESESDSTENNSPPSSLEDLQQLSEDMLTYINNKDWSMSAKQIKSIHSKWNDFFVEAQKKGISSEKVDNFNKDLNTLTSLIISKAMEDSKAKIDLQYKKTTLELEKYMSKEESNEEGNNKEQSGESSENSSNTSSNNSSSQNSSSSSEKDVKEEITLPEEILPDSYPLMTSTSEELEIAHAAVKLTSHIPYMVELFKSEFPSDILTLKYLLRNIKISSKQNKWDEVEKSLNEINEIWPTFQSKIMEEKDSLAIKFNQSIIELEDVIKQEDSTLTTIKCDIALENIKEMSELFE
ncbi:hypothetical protein [Defluviitalea phaphyphila]|uniref:hypothetical protein n=1 Tax=Defluviitalea phaphyphila TaxID=1473580 RepID=UPI0007312669|nr:hypothetical protein [Defluviitalea phaphyphila]